MVAARFLYRHSKKASLYVVIAVLLVHITWFLFHGSKARRPGLFLEKAGQLAREYSEKEKARTDSALARLNIPLSRLLPEDGPEPTALFYDPRYTISVYLSEIGSAKNTRNAQKTPVLPFHWADWTDLTFSDTQITSEETRVVTCAMLQSKTAGQPDYSGFCKDSDAFSDAEVENMGFKSRTQLPKAVIFGHSSHKNPSPNAIRVFMAKSYALTHMPKPYKVVILTAGEKGGTYEFAVDQNKGPDQRIVYSGMGERFVRKMGVSPQGSETHLKFNPKSVYDDLLRTVEPSYLAEHDDVMDMRRTVRAPPGKSKDLYLKESHFHYSSESVKKQIQHYEAMAQRSVPEQSYLEGLLASAQYDGTTEPIYFKMAILDPREPRNTRREGGWHYDWRFFSDALFYEKPGWTRQHRSERTSIILERLSRTWNRFAEEKGLVSWIMHGPLLSWYWNGLMFPYDIDIDIQMPVAELVRLAREYNQTLVVEPPCQGHGKFLIDVGSYIHNRGRSRTGNHIDARFIDVDSGIYIDITGLAKSSAKLPRDYLVKPIVAKSSAKDEVYNDRRKHFYTLPQLSPLHYSMIGGVPTFIPNSIEDRLRWEYGRGILHHEFRGWYFVPMLRLWVWGEKVMGVFGEKFLDAEGKFEGAKLVHRVKNMSEEEGLRLLSDKEVLAEYARTHKLTEWHSREKRFLFGSEAEHSVALDPKVRQKYDALVGEVKFREPLRKALYEYEKFDRD